MDIAYFRHQPNNEQFELVFRYQNAALGIDRVFNFQRNITEAVETTLNRIRTNVEKEFKKKCGGKKKNPSKKNPSAGPSDQKSEPNSDILISFLHANKTNQSPWSDLLTEAAQNGLSGSVLKVCDKEYSVTYNYPYIQHLTLPTVILVGFKCYPSKFEVCFTDRNSCTFDWYRGFPTENKKDEDIVWSKCDGASGFFYEVKESDIRHKIKLICTPQNGEKIGPATEVISKCTAEPGAGYCAFKEKHMFTSERLSGNQFRVISYNLLADYYCDSDFSRTQLFPYCPPFALAIDYRKLLFIREIIGYNSDICCLQEVDAKVFDLDLTLCLGEHNMDGLLQKKGETNEGVATFYNRDRFSLVQSFGINLAEHVTNQPYFSGLYEKIKNNVKLCERMLLLSTAVQVTVLKSKTNNQYLVVANTHLYFHPDADHIRLLQIGFFMLYVKHVYEQTILEHKLSEQNISIIFCGDFNSVPECGIYKLMTEKFVPDDFVDFKSNAEEAVIGVSLSQPFDIRSAYNNPKYTNFTVGFADCLDYIFYQTKALRVLQAVPLPSEEELRSLTAIPSIVFPSDHVALVADFEWIE